MSISSQRELLLLTRFVFDVVGVHRDPHLQHHAFASPVVDRIGRTGQALLLRGSPQARRTLKKQSNESPSFWDVYYLSWRGRYGGSVEQRCAKGRERTGGGTCSCLTRVVMIEGLQSGTTDGSAP